MFVIYKPERDNGDTKEQVSRNPQSYLNQRSVS